MGPHDDEIRPREELVRNCQPGPKFADLLYRTVQAIAHHYAPPPGSTRWDKKAQEDLAHQFLTRKNGDKRLISLVSSSVDEHSFAWLLEKAVHNFIVDNLRVSGVGKLITRIKQVLRDNAPKGHFVLVAGDRWALPGRSTSPTVASEPDLVAAMVGVQIVVPAWESETRDAPLADGASFVRLIEAVLGAADGAMTAVDLAHILKKRLNYVRDPLELEWVEDDTTAEHPRTDVDPAAEAVAVLRAKEFFDTMDDRERRILAHRRLSSRAKAPHIGLGHAQVSTVTGHLTRRLGAFVRYDERGMGCVEELFHQCDTWLTEQTAPADPTYETSKQRKEEGNG